MERALFGLYGGKEVTVLLVLLEGCYEIRITRKTMIPASYRA